MTLDLLYILTALIPFVMLPVVLPMVVLMAVRKRFVDAPGSRKLQAKPVVVMGGLVMVSVLCIDLIFVNIFYDIDILFPVVCVMMVMYAFGMLDDSNGLSWQFKLGLQIVMILLLFFGATYGVQSLYGLFGIDEMPFWARAALTVFVGLLIINGLNFIDGIDGLASCIGAIVAAVMTYWNIVHCFTAYALFSLAMFGLMVAFFHYNVFSKRFKMYMGDSGSLLLGLYIYVCVNPSAMQTLNNDFLIDSYYISFIVALLSPLLFDLVRVALYRMIRHKSPFEPDRSHLHHALVDLGLNHLLATIYIATLCIFNIGVWLLTALTAMDITLQFVIVVANGLLTFWGSYIFINYLKDHHPQSYSRISAFCNKSTQLTLPLCNLMARILDGRKPIENKERNQ